VRPLENRLARDDVRRVPGGSRAGAHGREHSRGQPSAL